MKSRSTIRTKPLSRRACSSGIISPVKWLPSNLTTRYSSGPSAISCLPQRHNYVYAVPRFASATLLSSRRTLHLSGRRPLLARQAASAWRWGLAQALALQLVQGLEPRLVVVRRLAARRLVVAHRLAAPGTERLLPLPPAVAGGRRSAHSALLPLVAVLLIFLPHYCPPYKPRHL